MGGAAAAEVGRRRAAHPCPLSRPPAPARTSAGGLRPAMPALATTTARRAAAPARAAARPSATSTPRAAPPPVARVAIAVAVVAGLTAAGAGPALAAAAADALASAQHPSEAIAQLAEGVREKRGREVEAWLLDALRARRRADVDLPNPLPSRSSLGILLDQCRALRLLLLFRAAGHGGDGRPTGGGRPEKAQVGRGRRRPGRPPFHLRFPHRGRHAGRGRVGVGGRFGGVSGVGGKRLMEKGGKGDGGAGFPTLSRPGVQVDQCSFDSARAITALPLPSRRAPFPPRPRARLPPPRRARPGTRPPCEPGGRPPRPA